MAVAIVTKSDVKLYAGITTTNQDALIDSLIPASLTAIGSFCNRDFSYQSSVTEYRDGNDSKRMQLANYPICLVSSVYIDGFLIPKSSNRGSGWVANPGSRTLFLLGYRFDRGIRNVEVNLSCGFGDDGGVNPWPADLQNALCMYIITRIKERERLGVGSKSLAGESVGFEATSGTSGGSLGIPSAAKNVLENYLNTVPETGQ